MRYREHPLPPPFDRLVECVWTAEADAAPAADAGPAAFLPADFDTIVPDGCPELILQLGDPFEMADGDHGDHGVRAQERAVLVGSLRGPLRIRPTGRVHTVGVRFRPGALSRVLPVPLHELTDRVVPLSDLFGSAGVDLACRVASARDGAELRASVQGFLGSRLRSRRGKEVAVAGGTVRALIDSRGQISVDRLAEQAGVSARQLERVFRDAVGLSPKRLARVVRLQEVLRRLGGAPGALVDIALDCGYADQAHLSREFRELAGDSPSRWVATDLAGQFTTPERLEAFFRN